MNTTDRIPSFHHRDILCPKCDTPDTVRMLSRCSETQHESVIWCQNGHITYLDRHDRAQHLLCTFDMENTVMNVRVS